MNRPAFSICLCPDSRLLQIRLDALLAAHPPQGGGAWQRFVFWSDEGLGPPFWEHLTLQGLFAVPKALVIRNAETLPADLLNKQLSPALMPLAGKTGVLPSPLIWPLVCLEVAFEKGKAKVPAHIQRLPFYLEAEKRGWLDTTPPLAGKNMTAFIRAECARQGFAVKEHELAVLANSLPADASFICSEIAKLALAAGPDGRIPADALQMVGASQELTIFELMRIVQQNSNAPAAWKQILESRLSGENMVFAFISILLREARILWQSLVSGDSCGLPPQVAMQKKVAAQGLGLPGIAKIWELALKADKGIKSGERGPEQSFEILAADLFILFGGRRAR